MKVCRFFVAGYFLMGPLFAEEILSKDSTYKEDLLHMIGTLVILLFFIFIALFIVRKLMRSRLKFINRSTSIKILEKRALHTKASLYLIEVLGKTVLISETQGHINLITEIDSPSHPRPLPEESDNPPKTSFMETIKKKINVKRQQLPPSE